MVVSEGQISNIMGSMQENTGIRLNNHKHKLRHRYVSVGTQGGNRRERVFSEAVCG